MMPRSRFQKVFVTNPTSIVGAHTINALVRSGYEVQYLLRHPFASGQQHFERRNENACYNPFLVPITAQPGDPIYETTCEKALDGVNAIVYTGPSTVQELVDWPTLRTGIRRLLASARKVDSPIKSLVLHTPARGIGPLFLPRADPTAPCPAPEHLPIEDLLQTWSQFRPPRASKDSSNPLPHFYVTNIASVPPLSLRPRLGEGVFMSPSFRDLVTPLQELDQHPPSLFTHHWVDPRDLADIITRAVTRDLIKFSHTPIALYFHKTVRPPPPKFLQAQFLVTPPSISESSREAIRNLILERHPEHPDAVASGDSPAPVIMQISEMEQRRTRLLLGRDWTPPEETIRDLLGHLGPDIPAMTANTSKLQDQATAFLQTREMEKQRARDYPKLRFVRYKYNTRVRFMRSKSTESNAEPQGSMKAKANASLESKAEGTCSLPLLADTKAKSPKKQPKETVEASSTPTPISSSSPPPFSLNNRIEEWRTFLAESTPPTPTKTAAPVGETPQKSKAKSSQSLTTNGSSSSLRNSIEDWCTFLADFTPPKPTKTAAPARRNKSNRVSTAKASSSSSGGIKRLGRASKRKEVKKPKAGAVWELSH